jgi:hypothetical protein
MRLGAVEVRVSGHSTYERSAYFELATEVVRLAVLALPPGQFDVYEGTLSCPLTATRLWPGVLLACTDVDLDTNARGEQGLAPAPLLVAIPPLGEQVRFSLGLVDTVPTYSRYSGIPVCGLWSSTAKLAEEIGALDFASSNFVSRRRAVRDDVAKSTFGQELDGLAEQIVV